MNFWSAQNWCQAKNLTPASRADIGCGNVIRQSYCTDSPTFQAIQEKWGKISCWHWLEDYANDTNAYGIYFTDGGIYYGGTRSNPNCALCY